MARIDVAEARAATDDLDGASAALQPVFALPGNQRIQQIAAGLERVRHRLAVPRYTKSRAARELAGDIAAFGNGSSVPSPE